MEYTNDVKRSTGLLVIEVVNSNPNGDPDRESDPRQRSNGCGEISPVSFKRKLRDLLENRDGVFFREIMQKLGLDQEHFYILESRGRDRSAIQNEMSMDTTAYSHTQYLQSEFVKKYWDARVFGNTFLEGNMNKSYIKTGVVQFGVGVSISPINVVRHTNTNKAGVEKGKDQGMAPMAFRVVEHGVYLMPFFVNPNLAEKTGCTQKDIEVMKALIPYAYDMTRSAIRPDVRIRHAWLAEHKHILGSCPDYMIFDALSPKRIDDDPDEPSTSWEDYMDVTSLPQEIANKLNSCIDLLNA